MGTILLCVKNLKHCNRQNSKVQLPPAWVKNKTVIQSTSGISLAFIWSLDREAKRMKCNRGPRPHSRALSLHGVYIYTGQIPPLPPPSPCSPSHPHTHTFREKLPHKTATTQNRIRLEQRKCCKIFFLSTNNQKLQTGLFLWATFVWNWSVLLVFQSISHSVITEASISRKKRLKHPEHLATSWEANNHL